MNHDQQPPPGEIRVRDAVDSDLEGISGYLIETQEIHRKAYPNIYGPLSKDQALGFLRESLQKPEIFVRVAVIEGRIAGYSFFELQTFDRSTFKLPRRLFYIAQIAVDESQRRAGVGQALLEDVRTLAKTSGVDRLELEVWDFNVRARNFFSRNGFSPFGSRMFWNG